MEGQNERGERQGGEEEGLRCVRTLIERQEGYRVKNKNERSLWEWRKKDKRENHNMQFMTKWNVPLLLSLTNWYFVTNNMKGFDLLSRHLHYNGFSISQKKKNLLHRKLCILYLWKNIIRRHSIKQQTNDEKNWGKSVCFSVNVWQYWWLLLVFLS